MHRGVKCNKLKHFPHRDGRQKISLLVSQLSLGLQRGNIISFLGKFPQENNPFKSFTPLAYGLRAGWQ